MDSDALKSAARNRFQGSCRVCPKCNGVACSGEVPGMGGSGTGATFRNNIEALANVRLNMRTIHAVSQPSLACHILGLDLALPVIGAPIAGTGSMKRALTEEEYSCAVVNGCRRVGTIAMTGDGSDPKEFHSGLKALKSVEGYGIPVIKPRKIESIIAMAKLAADAGAPAFGVDVDAAAFVGTTDSDYWLGPKTVAELRTVKQQTTIPFIVKGIMTPDEAEACCTAGVDAIVVSNHGGRVLDHLPGTAEVLPGIAAAVKGKITILVDGGIRHGVDVLKMLALGADAVLVGRSVAIGAVGGGSNGVEFVIHKLAGELRAAMVLTGTADVASVSRTIIANDRFE